jgi:SAM-dependent methyltransferase
MLDASCGTGKYFLMVAAAGHQVAGADQLVGMLAQARARRIARQLEQVALQDLSYFREFDAVLTVDAEHPARRAAIGAGQSAQGRRPGRGLGYSRSGDRRAPGEEGRDDKVAFA